jgi:alpha-tubulin suppressor-like RCC1 family protein
LGPTGPFLLTSPTAVPGGFSFVTLSFGGAFTCGLTVGGRRAYCCRFNDLGQMGNGTTTGSATPVEVSGGRSWRQIAGGYNHACGISTAGQAFCWGADALGDLGEGPDATPHLEPSAVAGGHRFTQISAGLDLTCAVTLTQRAYCWGEGDFGAIGDGKTLDCYEPRLVVGGLTMRRVGAGRFFACGGTTTSRAYCWGWGANGQVGNGTLLNPYTPAAVTGGLSFAQVTVGDSHACGITKANVTYCWGLNFYGTLGDGTHVDRCRPTLVQGPM